MGWESLPVYGNLAKSVPHALLYPQRRSGQNQIPQGVLEFCVSYSLKEEESSRQLLTENNFNKTGESREKNYSRNQERAWPACWAEGGKSPKVGRERSHKMNERKAGRSEFGSRG